MSELLNKTSECTKREFKKFQGFTQSSHKPTKKCAMKMKERKKRLPRTNFVVKGRIYNAVSEDWPNRFQ